MRSALRGFLSGFAWRPITASIAPIAMLGGCATLPSSGPTAHDIVGSNRDALNFTIVDVDRATIEKIAALPKRARSGFASLARAGVVDTIGPGDVLQVSVYEVGSALFASRSSAPDAGTQSGSGAENFPPIVVGREGGINMPYVGRVMVAGKTADEVAGDLSQLLRAQSENPQAVVSVRENVSNTFVVQGDVHKPGRFPLSLARDHLLDAVAIAGGSVDPSVDSLLKLSRDGRIVEAPLSAIDPGGPDDIEILPQDRISVSYQPVTFTVLGASGKADEVPFRAPRVSLAEALGRAGGLSDQSADPSAVFVFRYEPANPESSSGGESKPIAYRFNMRAANGYFLAQRFDMRPRDVVYIANARAKARAAAGLLLSIWVSSSATALPTRGAAGATRTVAAGMLPARLLDCELGRITNFDPNKEQAPSDYVFDGRHRFELFLPSVPVRTTPPPASTGRPEPVDPRTRIVSDADGLGKDAPPGFDRVVDYWPDRVEMTKAINDFAVRLIIVDPIDVAHGTANLFMTRANDAITYDTDHLYAGICTISTGAAAEAAAR